MDRIDAYLEELVSHLDCDPLRRDEIRLEVHAHLRELLEEELKAGASADEAAARAIARFGPAAEVAARLSLVHRSSGAPQVRTDRPVAAVALIALVIAPLAMAGTLFFPWIPARLLDASAGGPTGVWSARQVASGLSLYPGSVWLGLAVLAMAVAAYGLTPSRPWVWGAVGYGASKVLFVLVMMGFVLAQPSQRHSASVMLGSYMAQLLPGAVREALAVMGATICLPWLGRRLGRPNLRLPLPLLLVLLVPLAVWAHPQWMGLGSLMEYVREHRGEPFEPGLAAWHWQATRFVAMLVAMWLAGQAGLQFADAPGRAGWAAVGVGLVAGLVVSAAFAARVLLAPHAGAWNWVDGLLCAEYLLLLGVGSAVVALTRMLGARSARLSPVLDEVVVA